MRWIALSLLLVPQDREGLVLAEGGKSPYRIVLPKDALPSERYAAEELQSHLKTMCGATLPIEQEPTGARDICLIPRPGDGRDGFSIRTEGKRLLISGDRPRGILNAVYVLLEEHLGVRWFTRDVTRIPKKDRIELPALDVSHTPTFEYRETFYFEAFDGTWAARQRSNGHAARLEEKHGRGVRFQPFVHSFEHILRSQDHFEKHPEYFSEIGGKRKRYPTQLCLTNPEVLRIAIDTVKRWIREHPEATLFSVSQNDCYLNCQCASCKALDDAEGGPIGSLLTFVNKVAEEIEKEHPDKLIETLAYQYSRKPPKTLVPRRNVRIRLCSIECCFSHPLDACARNRSFVADIEGWSKITDRLYIWDYVVSFGHYLLPFPNFDSLQPNVRFFARNGVKGLMEQGAYQSEGSEMSELRQYVIAKLLWNPNVDVRKTIEEFTDGVYHEAGPYVRRYLELLQSKVRERPIHVTIGSNPGIRFFKEGFVEEAEAIFDEAAAKVKDPAALKRLRKARLCVDYARLVRTSPKDPEFGRRQDRFLKALEEFGVTHISEFQTVAQYKKTQVKKEEY